MMAAVVFSRATTTVPPSDEPPAAVVGPMPALESDASVAAAADGSFSTVKLSSFSSSSSTGEKPQSKVWQHDGIWWTAMPDSSGMWVRRLDGTNWTKVLKISSNNSAHADVQQVGDVTHVLLFNGSSSQLASIEYVPASHAYQMWSARPNLANINLSGGVETATITVDSTSRMWLASDGGSTVEVRYSDGPYSSWSGPITLATNITSDDICGIVAMPDGKIGVFWSNQNTERFGFRTHVDGTSASTWTANENPAGSSAQNVGGGFADDHVNLAVTSDGTVYVAVKTSYDTSGLPAMMLLVRRPNGQWDRAYSVDSSGTRGVVAVSESHNRLFFIYTSSTGDGDIVYRESPLGTISFGGERTLISGTLNDPSTVKDPVTNELVVIATGSSGAVSAMLRAQPVTPPPPPPNPGDPVVVNFQDGVSGYTGTRDTFLRGDKIGKENGDNTTLEVAGDPDYAALLSWDVRAIATGSTVQNATVTLQVTDASAQSYDVFAVNRAWDEAKANWTRATKKLSWQAAGAQGAQDRDATPIGTLSATSTGQATITFNSQGLAEIQSWVNNPTSNFGIIIQGYGNSSDAIKFASSEASSTASRPKLSVTYTAGAAPISQAASFAIATSLETSTKKKR